MANITLYTAGFSVLTEDEADSAFQDYINALNPTVTVLGYLFDPARALKALDETAYHQEFINWIDANFRTASVPDDIFFNEDDKTIIEYIDSKV